MAKGAHKNTLGVQVYHTILDQRGPTQPSLWHRRNDTSRDRRTVNPQTHFEHDPNEACMNTHLDLLVERRERAHIQDMEPKLRATRKYNSKLDPQSFHKGDPI